MNLRADMQKKLFYHLSISLFILGLSFTITPLSASPAIIEEVTPTNTHKFFYIPCEKLPSEGLQEIKLKRDKITLTEDGTAKLLEKCKTTKTSGTFLVRHPISQKNFVLQITFNATQETKSPGIVLPPYTDIRIYGLDKQCPKDTEQFIVDLFTPKSQTDFYLKLVAGLGVGFIISKLTGATEKVTNFWAEHKPSSVSQLREDIKNLKQSIVDSATKVAALSQEVDDLSEDNLKLTNEKDQSQEARAGLTTQIDRLTSEVELQNARIVEAKASLTQKEREAFELTQKLAQANQALATSRATLAPRRHQAAHTLGAGAHSGESDETTSLSETAKNYFFQMGANKALVTIEDLRAQTPDLNVALHAWLSSKQILILTTNEVTRDDKLIYKFLLDHKDELSKRFLILNDTISDDSGTETYLVNKSIFNMKKSVSPVTIQKTGSGEERTIQWNVICGGILLSKVGEPTDHTEYGFVDGRLQSEIKADFENTLSPSAQIRKINDFFALQIVFTS